MWRRLFLVVFLVSGGSILPSHAQQPPISPRESVAARIDGSDITIVYGRPQIRDPRTGAPRKIWGGLVPYGKVWRTGANEATTLTTTWDLEFGGQRLPAGTYSLFTLPNESKGQLIVNRQTGQWGTQYDESQNVLKVEMTRQPLSSPVQQFTIVIERRSEGGGVLRFRWADAEYSLPFRVLRPPPLEASAR